MELIYSKWNDPPEIRILFIPKRSLVHETRKPMPGIHVNRPGNGFERVAPQIIEDVAPGMIIFNEIVWLKFGTVLNHLVYYQH